MNIYVVIEGEQRGPLSSGEVRELLESGKLKPDDPALLEGEKQWSTVARMARRPAKGTVAAEPTIAEPLRAAVFSCNADHGFPDGEVVRHVSVHEPDLALFLGDQFYEGSGGFGIQTDSLEEATLDMLHKWYMFGWSYREIFRRVPASVREDGAPKPVTTSPAKIG